VLKLRKKSTLVPNWAAAPAFSQRTQLIQSIDFSHVWVRLHLPNDGLNVWQRQQRARDAWRFCSGTSEFPPFIKRRQRRRLAFKKERRACRPGPRFYSSLTRRIGELSLSGTNVLVRRLNEVDTDITGNIECDTAHAIRHLIEDSGDVAHFLSSPWALATASAARALLAPA
jgi:hypothetical protein